MRMTKWKRAITGSAAFLEVEMALSRSEAEKQAHIYADETATKAIAQRVEASLKMNNVRTFPALPSKERAKLVRLYHLNYYKPYQQMFEKLMYGGQP